LLAVCAYGAWWAFTKYRESRRWQNIVTVAGRVILIVVPAVVTCAAWTGFCDHQKSLNRIGQATTSSGLTTWNFGTWEQRLDWQQWSAIAGRYGLMIGDFAFLSVCALGLLKSGRRRLIVASLLLAASAPLIFTNLYIHHEYYAYASGLFVIGAVGIGMTALWEYSPLGRIMTTFAFIGVVVACGYRYQQQCHPKLAQHAIGPWFQPVVEEIQKRTKPDEVILVLGFDWSSEIAYYSRRRALMIPDWETEKFLADPQPYLDDLRGHRLGGLVIADLGRLRLDPQGLRRVVDLSGMSPHFASVHQHRFSVYSREDPERVTRISEMGGPGRDVANQKVLAKPP
jgi:hypothetical protein